MQAWAEVKPEIDAPFNSMESEDDFPLYDSQDSEEGLTYPYIPKDKLKNDPSLLNK